MSSREFDIRSSVTAAQQQGIGFNAYSVQVDNNSNQWLFLPDVGIYVSPYTIQAVFKLGGTSTAAFQFIAKPGTVLAPAIAGEYAIVTYFDYDQPASAGQTTVVRAPSGERRNPVSNNMFYFQSNIAPHSATARWTYTVPVGRRAVVEAFQAYTELETAGDLAVTNAVGYAESFIRLGTGNSTLLDCNVQDFAPARSRSDAALGTSIELASGATISGITDNFYTATLATHYINARIVEFDA